MIAKVMRGRRVGGLLRYLYGPGTSNEHVDPHLVAGWDDPVGLEPELRTDGRHDLRRLTGLLEQPLAAAGVDEATRPVWHCPVRVAPGDRRLTDAEWADVAQEIVDRTGLARRADEGGCRWVAVRHADDHIHLVVTLARQDGRRARPSNDYYRVAEACAAMERKYGLTVTAGRDRTASKRPSRGEREKAQRACRREPPRVTLRREVQTAAAGAASEAEFLTRLRDAGLLVKERHSIRDPEHVTGYAVAWPGDRDGGGQPVWYGGGKLAADLSLPKLLQRWQPSRRTDPPSRRERLTPEQRRTVWERAARTTAAAGSDVRRLATADPAAAADAASAASEALHTLARVSEGGRGGPLTAAADAYDRAARELHGRVPTTTPTGNGLRGAARLLALCGRAGRDETTQVLALVVNLAALADAVSELRAAQGRAAQAAAARDTAARLRTVAPTSLPPAVARRTVVPRAAPVRPPAPAHR